MAPAQLSGDAVVARSGSDAMDFVGSDAHADARAADQDAAFDFGGADGPGDFLRVIRVVHAAARIGTEVEHFVAQLLQERDDPQPDSHAAMVAADGDLHAFTHCRRRRNRVALPNLPVPTRRAKNLVKYGS